MTADPDLTDIDRFIIKKKNSKTGNTELLFFDANNHEYSLTNNWTSEFLAPKTLREKFGGLNILKNVLSLDEAPPALERSFTSAAKPNRVLSLPTDFQMEPTPLDILIKTREASQNTDLDMREFLGIDKALQNIQGELLNNT